MLYLSLYFYLLLQITTATDATAPSYTPTDFILLNCGSLTSSKDQSNRSWEGDQHSKYASSTSSSAHQAFFQDSSVNTIPYMTARIFPTEFTYIFPVVTGSKFIRLYFYPNTYSNFNTSSSFFSVTVNNFTLLTNFSANLNVNDENPSFMKEYLINVKQNQSIQLTFSPNQNSFAFVNGIEIVSVPDKLYFKGNDVPIKSINQLYYLNDDTILENLYRLNIGGADIEIQDDTYMFRAWHQDHNFIFGADFGYTPYVADSVRIDYTANTPPYTAPKEVYTTSRTMSNISKSLEWYFPVDSGFYYLHRFHFCETDSEVTLPNQRVFTISVDNQILEIEVDVIELAGGSKVPISEDYITWVRDDGHRGRKDLRLSLFPYMETNPLYSNALLNGLEIFKLSDTNGSLAAANPEPSSPAHDVGESSGIVTLLIIAPPSVA